MGNKSSKKKSGDTGTSGGDSRASQPGETWDAGSIDENPDDEVEAHYEPVLVAPGVQLIAKRDGRTSALVNENIEVCYRKWVSDRIQSAIQQKVCTFVYTDRVLSEQKWAQCQTCIAAGKFTEADEGICSICRVTCHSGHVFGPEKTSQNICACGENNCSAMQKAKVRDVFEDHRTSLKKDILAFKRATGIKIQDGIEPPVIENKDEEEECTTPEAEDKEDRIPMSSSFSQPHLQFLPTLVVETKEKAPSRSAPTSPARKPGIVVPFTPGKGRLIVPRSNSNIEQGPTPTIRPPPESPGLTRTRTQSGGAVGGPSPLRPSRSFGT